MLFNCKMKFRVLLLCLALVGGSFTVSNANDDVLRGDDMADPTTFVDKVGITILPHVELEYRYDFSGVGGIDVDNTYPAVAFGVAFNHKRYTLDIFGRSPFSQPDDIDDKGTYGGMLTYVRKGGRAGNPYVQFGLDSRDVTYFADEDDGLARIGEQYQIESTNVRMGIGIANSSHGSTWNISAGGLGYFGDVNGTVWNGSRFIEGSDGIWGLGFYSNCQLTLNLTQQLKFNLISLQLEYRTGVSDTEIAGKEIDDYLITAFVRTGLTYIF